jgi:hypothetical protein
MPRRKPSSQRLAWQVAELAFAAPQVVAHRVARMATAGNAPSARDRAEFARMGSEKVAAFYQSWAGMWAATLAAQMELAAAGASMAMAAAQGANANGALSLANAATKVVAAGLTPVHKKAVANAKRLSRRRA